MVSRVWLRMENYQTLKEVIIKSRISFTSNLMNIETVARRWDIYDRCAIEVKIME